jgi:hypothetical protein
MPAHLSRRGDARPDDPWGFGIPEGTIVECSIDTLEAALGSARADSPRRSRPQRPRPWPAASTRPSAPRRRRHTVATVMLALAAVAASGAAGYFWFAPGTTQTSAGGPAAPPVTSPGVVDVPPQPPGVDVVAVGAAAGVTRAPNTAAATTSPAAPLPAFVSFDVPFDVRIYENGGFVGTNAERIRVPPGRHTFTMVNDVLGFRTERTVLAVAGRSTQRVIGLPSAPLSVNAQPWAEVFMAGRSLGETPIASITLPVGTHQLTLRHPTLGERDVAMTVRLGAPNRLSVDMRR